MVPRCFEALGLKSCLEGLFPLEQVGRHVAQDSEIFRSMIFAYPAVVFPEGHVQAPVQAIFYTPMLSDGFGDGRGVVFEAGDEIGRFNRNFSVNIALPNGHADGVNACPLFFSLKPVDIAGREIPSGFDAAMVSIKGFESVEGPIGSFKNS